MEGKNLDNHVLYPALNQGKNIVALPLLLSS